MTSRTDRILTATFAEPVWTQEPDELGYQRSRAVDEAARHLASLTPERQAFLENEWSAK